MGQPYFDLHFHPVNKQFLTRFEEKYPTSRDVQEIVKAMDLKNDLMDVADEIILHILESQCCLDQIKKGGVRLGIVNVVSIEHGIADSRGFLSNILKSGWTKPLDQNYMKLIQRGQISYYRLFIKELDLYRSLSVDKNNNPYITFLTRKDPATKIDENKFYVALGMEGGHNLSRLKIARPGIYDNQPQNGDSDAIYNDFCQPPEGAVKSLQRLHQALWKENMDLFYVTLTHLSHIVEQPLATHAFGMKLLQHGAFYPVGNGITPLGEEVIDAAYSMTAQAGDKTVSAPILIDIKHMSLKSRLDFYNYRKAHSQYDGIPIIASHMGVTGYSIYEWKDALSEYALFADSGIRSVEIMTKRKKCGEWGSELNNDFTYNPWSINLMDEDIIEILKTGGLIGVSLDIRILGFQAKIGASSKEQSEYLSVESFKTFFPHLLLKGASTGSLESLETLESWLVPTKEERHPLCLCFNIIHIVAIAKANEGEIGPAAKLPWEYISIGSDFDGLIDPVKICRNSSQMPELEKALLKWLPVAEKAYRAENEGPHLLDRNEDKSVNYDALRKVVRGIMYENGRRFLQHWVSGKFVVSKRREVVN